MQRATPLAGNDVTSLNERAWPYVDPVAVALGTEIVMPLVHDLFVRLPTFREAYRKRRQPTTRTGSSGNPGCSGAA